MTLIPRICLSLLCLVCLLSTLASAQSASSATGQTTQETESIESKFLSGIRQLTFEGRRAGEGYFSQDGSQMVFQSERNAENPFFQMYLLDFETGDVTAVSPGYGKTTCGWIHPDNRRVLFASTQGDPEARAKQQAEIEFRESGQERRYAWDYDEHYELYSYDRESGEYTQLTDARGYDAEASYSPDGSLIAFASNRNGYQRELSEREQSMFETDPAYMMEIFIMNADGSNVRQLTDVPGYDGGPFFSPDGKHICWRRFSENGLTAEIMTMKIDGSEQRRITAMKAMSWAPFYHPSGEYLIFTTNKHGFSNFELYIVDAAGRSEPVRVTDTDGFDGLASFHPDGNQLTWTSNRGSNQESQIFLANWNHEAALEAIRESGSVETTAAGDDDASTEAEDAAVQANAAFDPRDVMRHVDYLCRPELRGRMTGSQGEKMATAYVAAYFDHLGLVPAGDDGTWFQTFEFPNGAELGDGNQLALTTGEGVAEFQINRDWRPLTFSGNVNVDPTEIVFAGYGIVAPEQAEQGEYDSYVHLDVKDKWVLVFRFVPEDVEPATRRHLQFYGTLRKKLFYARQREARGLIVVSGPNSQVREQLVPLQNDFSPSGSSIAAISITDDVAAKMLSAAGKDLAELQGRVDSGEPAMGFDLSGVRMGGRIEVRKLVGVGRNVVGRLAAGPEPSAEAVLVGAHIDHLGAGKTGGSLARDEEQDQIHVGADDNASGVAAMLEVAEYLAMSQKQGKLKLKRDVLFAGWSGEELGLHGSRHFAESRIAATGNADAAAAEPQDAQSPTPHDFDLALDRDGQLTLNGEPTNREEVLKSLQFIGQQAPDFEVTLACDRQLKWQLVAEWTELIKEAGVKKLTIKANGDDPQAVAGQALVAALNMDMVGRLEDKLILQGVSSSSVWPGLIESTNAVVGLPVSLSNETDLPTDASSFYQAGVPILSAFTGSHTDYHTPRDTPDKLNYPDAARIARLMGLITRSLATDESRPDYIEQQAKPKQAVRGGLRAYLGTVPSYGDDVVGVLLSDATAGAPAAEAGVQGGDTIVELAGAKIENIYDYTAVLDTLKIGEAVSIVVQRDGKRIKLEVTPSSRK